MLVRKSEIIKNSLKILTFPQKLYVVTSGEKRERATVTQLVNQTRDRTIPQENECEHSSSTSEPS